VGGLVPLLSRCKPMGFFRVNDSTFYFLKKKKKKKKNTTTKGVEGDMCRFSKYLFIVFSFEVFEILYTKIQNNTLYICTMT
jgi:hypothetical protein